MPTYGPSRSPFGQNQALNAYARQIKDGDVAVTKASAEKVMELVGDDGRITVEEAETLDDLWDHALHTRSDPAGGHTPYGRELMLNYTSEAKGRLFAHQVNSSSGMSSLWARTMSFGFFDAPKPSYVGVDQSPSRHHRTTTPVDVEARQKTNEGLAGPEVFARLLKEHPAAIAEPGSTGRRALPQPEVLEKYESLRAEIDAGQVDEHDPLGELRALLQASYA